MLKKKENHKIEVPQDLGIKFGSKTEELWTRFRDARKNTLESLKESQIIETALVELAEKKIKEAREDWDKNF